MSSGNFGSFARCLVPWSVASAVMGRAMERDVARWTVRLSEEALDELLIPQIRRLLESGSKIGEKAGHILLDVLGTKAASELLREFPEVESEEARERRLRHEADPCLSIFAWSHEECENCLERSDVPLHLIFAHARDRLIDPTRGVPSQLIARAVTTLLDIDPSKIHENLFHNRELSLFNELAPFIGAHAPDELADYVRSVVRSMPHRNLRGRRQLALWMDEIYPVFGETELTALRSVIDELRAADWPELSPTMRVCLEQEAEGFALCGVLPHLAPGDRYREMMKRPDNALEAAAVYEWLQPVSRESFNEGLGFIHSAADERSLVRSLWLLALARPPLTSFDKDRLVALAHNPNSMIRATILRFVCLSNDEEMGRRLVDVGTKYTEPENQDESYWGTRLLRQYSGSSDFEMLASRVNPAAASHLIEARGCITEEAAFNARSLDAFWRKVIGASAPRIDPLPNILIDSGSDCLGTELPKLDVADNSSIRIQDASTSWTSEQTGSLPETFQRWGESVDIQRLRREGENRVKAVMTAWRTDAFALYGRRFSHKALAAIHTVAPDIVRNWVSEATGGGSRREIAFVRLGAFYVDLCEALLRVDPELGFKLWIALRTARSLVSFSPMQVAFRAPRSEPVDRARWQELNQCTTDESLSCLSCLAQLAKDGWLEETVHRLLNSRFLARMARGLTLASLAHFDTATFERYVDLANVTGTWVEGTLDTLRRYHWRDQAAWRYYERFLREPSSDRSWAAFRLFIHLTDRRFDVWRKICEASSSPPKDRIKLADISGELKRVTERCKDREDVLFGMKRQPGEVYPFLE